MTYEVIMPQLGMAQKSGVIVKWRKQPGDFVNAGDVLMEVETDKAVMEVEAEYTGHLLQIACPEGEAALVGNVVALIDDHGGNHKKNVQTPAISSASASPSPKVQVAELSAPPKQTLENAKNTKVNTLHERILSSPKARRRARELGVDLNDMRANHLQEPFHAADIEKFAVASPIAPECISLEVLSDDFMTFVRWAATESEKYTSHETVLRAFATRAWRKTIGSDVVIAYVVPGETAIYFANCDLSGVGESEPIAHHKHADLILYNLIDAGISDYQPGAPPQAPTLTVSANISGRINAIFRFQKQSLPLPQAITFMRDFSMQLTTPLKHLL